MPTPSENLLRPDVSLPGRIISVGLALAGAAAVLAPILAYATASGDSQFGPLKRAVLLDGLLLLAAAAAATRPFFSALQDRCGLWRVLPLLAAFLLFIFSVVVSLDGAVEMSPGNIWNFVTLPGLLGLLLLLLGLLPRTAVIQMLVLLLLFALAEFGAWGLIQVRKSDAVKAAPPIAATGSYYSGYFANDSLLGYRGTPNRVSSSRKMRGDQVVYDVAYDIGPEGFRTTPRYVQGETDRFIAFFGDSFTIGEGVADGETLPARLAQMAPDQAVYNYGFHGYGPQQMLALIDARDRLAAIRERQGTAIYVYQSSHIMRLKGSFQVQAWGHHMPYYRLSKDGQLEFVGNFTSGRPFFAAVYPLLSRSWILRWLKFDPWSRISDEDEKLAISLFKRACSSFSERFNSLGCYVLFFPGSGDEAARLSQGLRHEGVGVLDFSQSWGANEDEAFRLAGDGHANASGYSDIASRIVNELPDLLPRRKISQAAPVTERQAHLP